MSEITVLVADGQRLFAESLSLALEREPDLRVLQEHPTRGEDAFEAVRMYQPDVILVDYWIPGINGPATARSVRAWSPGPKVIILSWFHGPSQVQEAIEAGVNGFLPKSVGVAEVTAAIRRAHAGEDLVYAAELARMVERIQARAQHSEERMERMMKLTPREVEILRLLASGSLTKRIAVELGLSVGTIKNHIHNILKKTGARNQLEAVAMAQAEGLIAELRAPGTSGAGFEN